MATYTIVANTTDPLGPGEIRAGQTIQVSEGDVFIVDASANAAVVFAAAGGVPANFDVVFNATNTGVFKVTVGANLTPRITVADNVALSSVTIDAVASTSLTMTVGDNASLGKFDGSNLGADVITIGHGFTATAQWNTLGGADSITVGDNATFAHINTGGGNDTLIFGDAATVADISTGAGNDAVFFEDYLDAGKIKTEDGDDTVSIGSHALFTEIDGGAGNDSFLSATDGGNIASMETTTMVCYAPGTMIDTPDGPRRVEALRPGDLVLSVDRGAQPIRWVHSGSHPLDGVAVEDRPVLIRAGALGPGVPARNLIVSPQHRILVGGGGQLEDCFDAEAFAPAKALTRVRGIRHMRGRTDITWIHFACDRHEVITANGCLSESLLLGPMVVSGLPQLDRRALEDIFGAGKAPDQALNGPPARTCLDVSQARRRVEEHAKAKGRSSVGLAGWNRDAAMERHEMLRLCGS